MKKISFLEKLKLKLSKTRKIISLGIKNFFSKNTVDNKMLRIIEELLITADVGIITTNKIMLSLVKKIQKNKIQDTNAVYCTLKNKMNKILENVDIPLNIKNYCPFLILVVGVNGVGKTTTIGKLARKYKKEGKTVMLAAGDTFRLGAIEQLCFWGDKIKIPVVNQHLGSDPASVIFDAIQSARSKKIDVLIADTAGRLQNKRHLMDELKKIVRVIQKLDKSAPHEIMLVIDASSGQNVIQQIKLFSKYLTITGITLTKLDGTAKGGIIFSIANTFSIPIRYIGVGEKNDDLSVFKSADFVEAMFSSDLYN